MQPVTKRKGLACVIGAGVVGLASAAALSKRGFEVLVLEATGAIGAGVSSRNSEVIHAGIYYPPNSVKAQACVEGKKLLYDFVQRHHIPHHRCGKLIVATNETESLKLDQIRHRAAANGVNDLQLLSPQDVAQLEPEVRCQKALLSPSSGIVDSHALMLALQGIAEERGAIIAFHTASEGIRVQTEQKRRFEVQTAETSLRCDVVVNAAGLNSIAVARSVRVPQDQSSYEALLPSPYLAKGNYFRLSGRSPFTRLIYPVPEPGGLGVHATIDLQGSTRFGPDVQWIEKEDYSVDAGRAEHFYSRIRNYWPGLMDGQLEPDYSGIRPKISGPGEESRDFLLQGYEHHRIPGLINLLGIESPGLTASLWLGERAAAMLGMTLYDVVQPFNGPPPPAMVPVSPWRHTR